MMNTRTKVLLAGGLLLLGACTATRADEPLPTTAVITTTTAAEIEAPTTTIPPSTTTTTPTTTTTVPLPAAASLTLDQVATITGDLSPKSIVHSGNGLFFAQNMMYRHTVTVYNRTFDLVETISDTVDLTEFGFQGDYRGAPVEAAFTSDGAYGYVSNYQMYGPGSRRPGGDGCGLAGWDESFVYRIDTATLEIDQIIPVGAVPKYVAVTPDDAYCWLPTGAVSTSVSSRLKAAQNWPGSRSAATPAASPFDPGSTTAYVAVMGSNRIAVLDLCGSLRFMAGGRRRQPAPPGHGPFRRFPLRHPERRRPGGQDRPGYR